ncbi:peptidase [Alginatibacterium sediminis]|uniref:Peptidase n=1 Tax=Alginatibacterium sediminis TaxID=2164068 RepID=A0A420E5U4_9ALTE|nr:imelysin family protein [Alginatibacterium sediminis]RKF12814.1 peptidase [Alginatibacterium sediminis]
MKLGFFSAMLCASMVTNAAETTPDTVAQHYSDLAHAVYSDALSSARSLQAANLEFSQNPSEQSLVLAQEAWKTSRVFYQQSEVFRFGNPVVDDWEGQLNAWPLDEGFIDYVDTASYPSELGNLAANLNIIASDSIEVGEQKIDAKIIDSKLLASLNELSGSEANVATGYHAIEFLLWGQDLNGTKEGAGERPYTDFVVGEGCTHDNCDRRVAYLNAASDLLVEDLNWMVGQWQKGGDYQSTLAFEPREQVLRRMFFGMGSLSLGELAGERMKVALEANSTEDEHDCFSDNTHNSHYYNALGVRNVLTGSFQRLDGSELTGPNLLDLVAKQDTKLAEQTLAAFDATQVQMTALVDSAEKDGVHFDQLIAPTNTEGHTLVQNSIDALVEQTRYIELSAQQLGIVQLNPDTADHTF